MNGLINASQFGVTPGTDCTSALQSLLDAIDGPAVVDLPAGMLTTTHPIIVGGNNVVLRGAGPALTTLSGQGLWFGLFESDYGGPLDPMHRPTVAGVLDSSCTSQVGFRTCGNAVVTVHDGAFARGGRTPQDANAYDGYGDLTGFSVYLAFGPGSSGTIPADAPLAGLRSDSDFRPWAIYTATDGTSLYAVFAYRLAGDSDAPNGPCRKLQIPINANAVNHLWVSLDFTACTASAVVNRQPANATGDTTFAAGSRFLRTRNQHPLSIGYSQGFPPDGAVAGWILYGLRTTGAPVTNLALTDAQAYYDATDPALIALYEGAINPLKTRLVSVIEAGGVRRWGWAHSTQGSGPKTPATVGCGVSDLVLWGGAPGLGIGDTLEFIAGRAEVWGNGSALATIGRGVVYPITARDCNLGSDLDAAVVLTMVKCLEFEGIKIQHYGRFAAVFNGAEGEWSGGLLAFNGPATRWGIASNCTGYGLGLSLRNLYADTESYAPIEGAIYAEQQPYGAASIDLAGVRFNNAGPCFLRAVAFPGGVCQPATYTLTGCRNEVGPMIVNADTGWSGVVN